MDPRFYYKVVVPTLLTGCAFVGITTLGEETNFVNRLISLRYPDGKLVMRVIALELVCDRCRQIGKSESCRHRMGELPYWHDAAKHRDVAMIMQDQMEDFMRETRGIQTNTMSRPVFDDAAVMRLLDPRNVFDDRGAYFPFMFTAVDPAAGASNSKFAVVTCIYDGERMDRCVVVGAEMTTYRNPSLNIQVLARHLDRVREIVPGLKNCVRVFIPESNLGFEAMHIERELRYAGFVGESFCVMQEDSNRAGVRMNHDLKKLMSIGLDFLLLDNKICFHRQFFTLSEDYTAERMKKDIVDQLLGFSRILIPSRDQHQPPKEKYSGKMGHGYDDMVIALMLNTTFKNRFLISDQYSQFRHRGDDDVGANGYVGKTKVVVEKGDGRSAKRRRYL